MLALPPELIGEGGLAPRSPSSYAYAVYPTFTFFRYSLLGHSISRERERKRERVNDENYHEKRERERDAVHPDVQRDQK